MDKDVAARLEEADRIRILTARFPDLRISKDRWRNERYSSASVNPLVTDYETRHTCGCCGDAPLLVFPYLNTEQGRVFSDPPSFYFARRDDWEGSYTLDPSFQESARKAGIPEAMIGPLVLRYPKETVEVEDGSD